MECSIYVVQNTNKSNPTIINFHAYYSFQWSSLDEDQHDLKTSKVDQNTTHTGGGAEL